MSYDLTNSHISKIPKHFLSKSKPALLERMTEIIAQNKNKWSCLAKSLSVWKMISAAATAKIKLHNAS